MSLQEKIALFIIIVCGIATITYLILMSIFGPYPAVSAFAILAIIAFTPVFYRKSLKNGKAQLDERDVSIQKKAGSIAFRVFWVLLVLGIMLLYYFYQDSGVISIEVFPIIIYIGLFIINLTWAVSILILYRKGS